MFELYATDVSVSDVFAALLPTLSDLLPYAVSFSLSLFLVRLGVQWAKVAFGK